MYTAAEVGVELVDCCSLETDCKYPHLQHAQIPAIPFLFSSVVSQCCRLGITSW